MSLLLIWECWVFLNLAFDWWSSLLHVPIPYSFTWFLFFQTAVVVFGLKWSLFLLIFREDSLYRSPDKCNTIHTKKSHKKHSNSSFYSLFIYELYILYIIYEHNHICIYYICIILYLYIFWVVFKVFEFPFTFFFFLETPSIQTLLQSFLCVCLPLVADTEGNRDLWQSSLSSLSLSLLLDLSFSFDRSVSLGNKQKVFATQWRHFNVCCYGAPSSYFLIIFNNYWNIDFSLNRYY